MKARFGLVALTAAALIMTSLAAHAQREERRPRRPDGPERGDRPGWDPNQMMSRMFDFQKQAIEATDEEWEVLEPLVRDVFEARMALMTRRGFGMRPRGGPGGPGGPGRPGGMWGGQSFPEAEALEKVLEDPDASGAEIQAKLSEYRKVQERAQQRLDEAQSKLREVLTPRQEARLVLMGTLD